MSQESTGPSQFDPMLVRRDDRASYDRVDAYSVLREGLVAHVGLIDEAGNPMVIPMLYALHDDSLFFHGAHLSRMFRQAKNGPRISATVTLFDGLVLARSAFHHSANYRSVVVLGQVSEVRDEGRKAEIFVALMEHYVPGRLGSVRGVSAKESRSTAVFELPVSEFSVKRRVGGPIDDEEDYDLPIWAGVLPTSVAAGLPIDDARLIEGIPRPSHLAGLIRRIEA